MYEQESSGGRRLREVGSRPRARTREYRVVLGEILDLGLLWPTDIVPEPGRRT